MRVVFDNSPLNGRPGVLLGFLEGREARRFGQVDGGERREAVVSTFARLFGAPARAPEDYVDLAWSEEQWTRGCYSGALPPGTWTGYGRALRASIGPLHWAGAETATKWNGYMDGAVRSGERAAAEVAAALGDN